MSIAVKPAFAGQHIIVLRLKSMVSRLALGITAFTGALGMPHAQAQQSPEPGRPNIVLIVADDLGYSDIGAFGGEIETPNLDALIASGIQLTNFYASPACSPTRSMLMSGTDSHLAGLGNMAEELLEEQTGKPGYEGYLNHHVVAFPQYLRDAGYHTYMAGKWHLGAAPDQLPASRGFEKSLALMGGGASHFDQGGSWVKKPQASYYDGMTPFTLPENFYSTDFYTDKMIEFMSNDKDGSPFFAYLAYSAPHWPLQAPRSVIDKYRGKYDGGYEAVREARIGRMKQLGLLEEGEPRVSLNSNWPKWSDLKPEVQRRESRLMETYAAMVDRLDYNIGRVVSYLKETGKYDNTIFVFMSDNGPEGNDPDQVAGNKAWLDKNFDNSIENIGNRTSFVGYGPAWGSVSSTPFRMFKGFTYEGGIHVPAFVAAPGRIKPGKNANVMSVMDIAPTLLDYAKVARPGNAYQGRKVEPIKGISQVRALSGEGGDGRDANSVLGWELFGRTAVRRGDWKLVWSNKPFGTAQWELFDLARDPAEANDISGANAEQLQAMMEAWKAYKDDNGVIWNETLADKIHYSNDDRHFASDN